jgi:hypothetical protein
LTIYHYAVVTKPEITDAVQPADGIDMETVDYKRQPDVAVLDVAVGAAGGLVCGIWRGGMFGLATNQIAVLSAWPERGRAGPILRTAADGLGTTLDDGVEMTATVRPAAPERITAQGFYVIRWLRMLATDVAEYTGLCLQTWPAFEAAARARCWGVLRPCNETETVTLLMLTWYGSLDDWERSRQFAGGDDAKWARRSEMELSHWAEGARLAT